ncbi:MAG: hypothetical protein UY11_C0048G0005 [Candidatus Amesbacteria bacterium GW2011_GWC2_47_8]|uniref:Uncharacterized protein n=1 Tax=Candidatus Amesbacteria bacterium GW2011_GWC2_47_8 TaxID=1618367 RepID=A0A0G1TKR3_9BACT|nr:MAG: hypothetical protein UY11_C0048G0005 [Candidatus Amesbacteria bacterium GW2011_GWC2_47_8]
MAGSGVPFELNKLHTYNLLVKQNLMTWWLLGGVAGILISAFSKNLVWSIVYFGILSVLVIILTPWD